MKILIRQALTTDAEKIAALSNQLGYHISGCETEANLAAIFNNATDQVAVAMYESEIVGWIHIFVTVRVESGAFAEIGGLVVSEKHRRLGIGKQLVQFAQHWTSTNKMSKLRVRCNAVRTEAHKFYQTLDFIESKEQKVFELIV